MRRSAGTVLGERSLPLARGAGGGMDDQRHLDVVGVPALHGVPEQPERQGPTVGLGTVRRIMRLSDLSLVDSDIGRGDLTNSEWSLLEPHLPPSGGRGGRWNDHRTVINGILCRTRTGIPWRDLPKRYGSWKTAYERHRRWSADGTWDTILRGVHADADLAGRIDWSMVGVDSTSCRAHLHAAGARKSRPRVPKERTTPRHHRPDEGLGRSRGGLTCKIHLAGEGGCRPLALLVTPGQ